MSSPDTSPLRAIHGVGDRIVPCAHAERLVAAGAGAERMAIPGREHVALFSHLAPIRQRVTAFLAALPA